MVDLVGGWADEATRAPVAARHPGGRLFGGQTPGRRARTSAGGGGRVGLDDPIVSVWPEFGAGGKETATLRHALCHRPGPAIRSPLTNDDLWDWDSMAAAVAEPTRGGSRYPSRLPHQYLRASDRRSRPRVSGGRAGPDCGRRRAHWRPTLVRRPPKEHHRCADAVSGRGTKTQGGRLRRIAGDALMTMLRLHRPAGDSSTGVVNTAAWRSAEVPSTNGHGTAGGSPASRGRWSNPAECSPPTCLEEGDIPPIHGNCPVLGEDVTFGLGFKPTVTCATLLAQPGKLWALRHRGCGRVSPTRSRRRVRLRDERRHPAWQSACNRALIERLLYRLARLSAAFFTS